MLHCQRLITTTVLLQLFTIILRHFNATGKQIIQCSGQLGDIHVHFFLFSKTDHSEEVQDQQTKTMRCDYWALGHVIKSKLASAGGQTVPPSRASSQENHSIVWRPRSHLTITKQLGESWLELGKRWKACSSWAKILSLIKFKPTPTQAKWVAQRYPSPSKLWTWLELGGPFGQGFTYLIALLLTLLLLTPKETDGERNFIRLCLRDNLRAPLVYIQFKTTFNY